MKLFLHTFFVLFVLFSACTTQAPIQESQISDSDSESEIIIVAFGDSLTEGFGIDRESAYPAQLQRELDMLGYDVKVYNSGLSGETSSGALARVDWVLRLNPDIVILGIGANDAIRGIDLEITDSNIREIVSRLKAENVRVILSGQIIFENLGEEYVNEFEGIYPSVVQDENLDFIPVFLEGVAANSSLNIEDEIHPNALGYEIVVKENVLPVVIPILDEMKE